MSKLDPEILRAAKDKSALARNIKHAVAAAGYTHDEIAYELGVSRRTVWTWISGRATPRDRHLEALAAQCGVTAESLLGKRSSPNTPTQNLSAHWNAEQQAWIVNLRIVFPPSNDETA